MFETPDRRRVRGALTAMFVLGCFLSLLSEAWKHKEVRIQEADLYGADVRVPIPGHSQAHAPVFNVELKVESLSFAAAEPWALVEKKSDPSDTDREDDEVDESEDEGSDDATGPDPNETWPKQVARGCRLVEMMKTPDAELDAKHKTPWHSYDPLAQYGWEYSDQDPTGDLGSHPNADEQKDSINSALDALGIPRIPSAANDQSGGWKKVAWIHSRQSIVDGHTYPATRAYMINYYNPGWGIIVAANTKFPRKASPHVPKDQLVPLGRWSDVTALTWADMCHIHSQNPNTLRYVMRINVAGDVAGDIVAQVIGQDLDELGAYGDAVRVPGIPDSDESRAAIGFPNGRGVGYLLVQHKDNFGDMRMVRDIKVWNSNNGVHERMAFFNQVPNILYTFS
ncbi:hypothetical protein DOTSEDRAFT_76355 [Dothistroma septosporum NZE10]|uniref:Uncharacterized protein n=1 Tax=Dothistroma septosporum (strain NZE10 / CBS 128990) TaxID=675120 RepID=N1Q2G9_DOTSN|nr:hypothetical protein DOTSEDRAFT_76355 [Dothistroma septosporum NZE10]